jgi:hypothetical protein
MTMLLGVWSYLEALDADAVMEGLRVVVVA